MKNICGIWFFFDGWISFVASESGWSFVLATGKSGKLSASGNISDLYKKMSFWNSTKSDTCCGTEDDVSRLFVKVFLTSFRIFETYPG